MSVSVGLRLHPCKKVKEIVGDFSEVPNIFSAKPTCPKQSGYVYESRETENLVEFAETSLY